MCWRQEAAEEHWPPLLHRARPVQVRLKSACVDRCHLEAAHARPAALAFIPPRKAWPGCSAAWPRLLHRIRATHNTRAHLATAGSLIGALCAGAEQVLRNRSIHEEQQGPQGDASCEASLTTHRLVPLAHRAMMSFPNAGLKPSLETHLANPAQIVAQQVHDHEVLCTVLLRGSQGS